MPTMHREELQTLSTRSSTGNSEDEGLIENAPDLDDNEGK